MKIIYNNNENALNEEKLTKELTNEEIDHFLKQFGSYKIFKPFFRRSFIAKQDKYNIGIHLKNEQGDFAVMFPLTDLGEVNLFRHTFYPYRAQHKDMYDYLLNLLSP
jgi:Zn-dependent M32 family carboxypeptidase